LGPARQAKAFSLKKLARLRRLKKVVRTKLKMPFHVLAGSALLMYRGGEVALVRRADVKFVGRGAVAVRLSHSKTDATARGFTVQWRCICSSVGGDALLCLSCLLREMAQEQFNTLENVNSQEPWFQTRSGGAATIVQIAATLRSLEKDFGVAVEEPFVALEAAYGGHSLRITGCRHWNELGLPDEDVRRLARWKSMMIDRYLADSPCQNMGPESLRRALSRSTTRWRTCFVRRNHQRTKTRTPPPQAAEAAPGQQYVVLNLRPGQVKFHRVVTMMGEKQTWAAACGWKFGAASAQCRLAHFEQAVEEKQFALCGRVCFSPEEQARLRPTQ
jgi:hypothetical protein